MKNINELIRHCSKKLPNGLIVVNVTPHKLYLDCGGNIITINSSIAEGYRCKNLVIDAQETIRCPDNYSYSKSYTPTQEGNDTIFKILEYYMDEYNNGRLKIVGSKIAAEAYPDYVVSMVPTGKTLNGHMVTRGDRFRTFTSGGKTVSKNTDRINYSVVMPVDKVEKYNREEHVRQINAVMDRITRECLSL